MAEQKDNPPSFRVTYFAFTGRAEPLRLAAALGGISFEDNFINQQQQKIEKSEGKRRWSGPPEITIMDKDGNDLVVIGQSNACLRYVGNLSGLYAQNPVQRALIDEILDSSNDLMSFVNKINFGQFNDEDKKKQIDILLKETLVYWLNKFESRLEENEKRGNKNGLLVGDSISIADLKLFCSFTYVNMIPGAIGVVNTFKRLGKLFDTINGNEKIKAFKSLFAANLKQCKEKKIMTFKYGGKLVPGAF